MPSRQREWRVAVIECGWLPRRGCVARRAIGRESRVGRSICRCKILLMAPVTICGEANIDVVLVARSARNRWVCACQRKRRIVVVKDRRLPPRVCCMARGARGREPRVRYRRGRPGKRGGMTCVAVGREPRIDIVPMAIGTRYGYMPSCQGKRCVAVIKCRRLPRCERMACRTVGREPRMGRRVRGVEIIEMATYARCGRPGILPVLVTLSTRNSNMRSR
jgi:hypothetical protein